MTFDTLTCNGVEKSLVDWGFEAESVRGRKINMAPDEFSAMVVNFLANGTNTSMAQEFANPTFPFESMVIVRTGRALALGVYSGGTIKFQGKTMNNPGRSNGSTQGVTYKFQGPFYDLENTHYQQYYIGGDGIPVLCAETVLNTSTATSFGQLQISVGDQLQAIAQWLLDKYSEQGLEAPYQYIGRNLNAGAIDLTLNAAAPIGTPGGNNSIAGEPYNFALPAVTTIGKAFYSVFYPSYITKPLTCADALRQMLRLSPRANIWFDYTMTPPMLHVSLPAQNGFFSDFRAVALPLLDGTSNKSLNISRRDDLKARSVYISYRITTTISGKQYIGYAQDAWGPNGSNTYETILTASGKAAADAAVRAGTADPLSGLRVVTELIDIQGFSETFSTGHLDCEPVVCTSALAGIAPADILWGNTVQGKLRGWWAKHRGGKAAKLLDTRCRFQDKSGAQTVIPDAIITNAATGVIYSLADLIALGFCDKNGFLVLNRLVRGTHHAWMQRTDGQPVVSLKVNIKAAMTYAVYDCLSQISGYDTDTGPVGPPPAVRHEMANNKEEHVDIEITNGTTGSYSTVESFTTGEAYIIGAGGIAQYLFNHLDAAQYDGEAVHVQSEFADSTAANYVDLGCQLNLSGPIAPEWGTMNAQIQTVEEDYFRKETTVQIGVAKHLNAGELSSLLNMWRNRRPWYNPAVRTNASAGGAATSQVDQPLTAGNANTVPGTVNNGAQTFADYSVLPTPAAPGTTTGLIQLDPQKITTKLAAGTVVPVETAS